MGALENSWTSAVNVSHLAYKCKCWELFGSKFGPLTSSQARLPGTMQKMLHTGPFK